LRDRGRNWGAVVGSLRCCEGGDGKGGGVDSPAGEARVLLVGLRKCGTGDLQGKFGRMGKTRVD